MSEFIDPAKRFDIEPSVGDHFAWLRTQMALQNTLMAAVRTSVSLIGFGFTVAQFFQRLQTSAADEGGRHFRPEAPRDFGLLLIATGVISLAVFTFQFHAADRYLRLDAFKDIAGAKVKPIRTSTYLIAWVVMLIGVAGFVSVFARF